MQCYGGDTEQEFQLNLRFLHSVRANLVLVFIYVLLTFNLYNGIWK